MKPDQQYRPLYKEHYIVDQLLLRGKDRENVKNGLTVKGQNDERKTARKGL